jgi:hypothetical protein
MKNAQKPDHISLTILINRLREGRFVIPDFQREFEWRPQDISELMRSIFRDYFIGSLLLWKGKKVNFDSLACVPVYGYEGNASPDYIVLDGQQRLTAMYYAFMAPNKPAPNRANRYLYFIRVDHFMDERFDEAFEYDWSRTGEKMLENKESQFEKHKFPLAIVGQGDRAILKWTDGYEKYWKSKEASALKAEDGAAAETARRYAEQGHLFDTHLAEIAQQYQISYIELDQDLEIDKVCDIFTQINSRGIRLDAFDLINALLKPKGLQLKHMWHAAQQRLEFVDTDRMNVYILQVISVLRQAYCSPKYLYYLIPGQEKQVRETDGTLRKEVLVKDIVEFEKLWLAAVQSLEQAINLLRHPQEFGAISSRYLPYVSILPAFAALQHAARSLPAVRQLDAQRKIRHWYWSSVFINRYSGSVESTTARDYLDVKAWFDADSAEPTLIGEFAERFKALDLRRETKLGSSVYNGIFNLLVLSGARDWMAGTVPQYGDLDDHHIVPKSWGKSNGLGSAIDSILNRSPLSADTNRKVISDRLPNEYLPELIAANGESTVRAILESHFISAVAFDILRRKPFDPDDFEAFLAERQRTLQEAIEDLLVKERLDLSPQLRELDAKVETVELTLRRIIDESLGGNSSELPSHVLQKIEERLQAAAKKNSALDVSAFQTLRGKLEYADLREVQDSILSKTTWPHFQVRFTNKEMLTKKFDQLAELRNGIRHSRTVDEITRKEGEASILWFQKVLGI